MKKGDRKTRIEVTAERGRRLVLYEAASAWYRLCKELEEMSAAEARPPRFNRLLRAIWAAATNGPS